MNSAQEDNPYGDLGREAALFELKKDLESDKIVAVISNVVPNWSINLVRLSKKLGDWLSPQDAADIFQHSSEFSRIEDDRPEWADESRIVFLDRRDRFKFGFNRIKTKKDQELEMIVEIAPWFQAFKKRERSDYLYKVFPVMLPEIFNTFVSEKKPLHASRMASEMKEFIEDIPVTQLLFQNPSFSTEIIMSSLDHLKTRDGIDISPPEYDPQTVFRREPLKKTIILRGNAIPLLYKPVTALGLRGESQTDFLIWPDKNTIQPIN